MEIPKKTAQTLINSLKGGVVPRTGLPYVTVGRKAEIEALLSDVGIIEEGGASFRFITGRYGSGKSFLLQTIRNYVMAKGMAVADADLSPERRLQGTKGQGLATYRELMRNMAVKSVPEGGALTFILDSWINNVMIQASREEMLFPGDEELWPFVDKKIRETLFSLNGLVHGFELARVLSIYYRAFRDDDDDKKSYAVKWLRGEYTTKTDVKAELGINAVISDDDWYEYLKIFAVFLKSAGYRGLLVLIDELVNIYRIPNSITRQYNYEKILTMYNDAMQGKASYMGVIMCGTPQSMEDTRRGVYSYEALRSRLASGRFSQEHSNLMAPVINLVPLTYEEMFVLAEKLTAVYESLYDCSMTVTKQDMADFIKIEFSRIGADSHITPREVTRDYIEALDIIRQEPGLSMRELLGSENFNFAEDENGEGDDMFAEFEI